MASHTLDDEEYQALQRARRGNEERIATLEAELVLVKQEDPANRIKPLMQLARAELTIVRFAVANLNPESTRGWPTAALDLIADLLPTLPDYSADDGDLANELRAFKRDCEQYALVRAQKREDKLKADAIAPKGDIDLPITTTRVGTAHIDVALPTPTPIGDGG